MGLLNPVLPRFIELVAGTRRQGGATDIVVAPGADPAQVAAACDPTRRADGALVVLPEALHPCGVRADLVTYTGGPRPEHGAEMRLAGSVPVSFTPVRAAEFAPATGITVLTVETIDDVRHLAGLAQYVASTGRIPSYLTGHRTVVADLDRVFPGDPRLQRATVLGSGSVTGVADAPLRALVETPAARRLLALLSVASHTPGVGGEVELSGIGGPLFPSSVTDEPLGARALAAWVVSRNPEDYRLVHVGGRSQFRLTEGAARVLEAYQSTGSAAEVAARVGCAGEAVEGLIASLGLEGAPRHAAAKVEVA